MKCIFVSFLIATTILVSGCSGLFNDSLTGVWHGVITDKTKTHPVELELEESRSGIEGRFFILKAQGATTWRVRSFPIIQSKRSENSVSLLIAMRDGEINRDSLSFELILDKDRLTGSGRELRKDSDLLKLEFIRKD